MAIPKISVNVKITVNRYILHELLRLFKDEVEYEKLLASMRECTRHIDLLRTFLKKHYKEISEIPEKAKAEEVIRLYMAGRGNQYSEQERLILTIYLSSVYECWQTSLNNRDVKISEVLDVVKRYYSLFSDEEND